MPLSEIIAIVLKAMQDISSEIGLWKKPFYNEGLLF
jgi:hypothetical protein